ncbi:MAG: hypothetical protein ACREAF_04655 [Nitrosopumilaceae archaeon]
MIIRSLFFAVSLISLLIIGTVSPIWAVQLDATIGTKAESAQPTFKFLRTIFLEYPEGGDLADLLRGKDIIVSFEADSKTPGVSELITKINRDLVVDLHSTVVVTDLSITYRAHLVGRGDSTAVDYKITMTPTITNYLLREATDTTAAIVDSHWRGIVVNQPVTIKTAGFGDVDINTPGWLFSHATPEVYAKMIGTSAEPILSIPVIDASPILAQPLVNWHHLFDATGTLSEASKFGYQGENVVITSFTMGESSLREGRQTEQEHEAEFTLDKNYIIRSIESASSANIQMDGFVTETTIEGIEYFGSSPKVPEGYATTSTGGFPVGIMYGMAGAGAVVAVIVLVMSDRKLKKQQQR